MPFALQTISSFYPLQEKNMTSDPSQALIFSIAIVAISWIAWMIKKSIKGNTSPLPPGPRGLPLIGNLPFLEPELHRYYAKLSAIYGPIFKLRLGNKLCVVLSSPSMAKEVLKDHDTTFANHDMQAAALLTATYGGSDIVLSPYGPEWRMLRRVCIQELLNTASLDAGRVHRRLRVHQTLSEVYAKIETPVDVGEKITQTIFNTMTSTLWGGTLKGNEETSVASEFRHIMLEIGELITQPNISDLFPLLARFDIQGVQRKAKNLMSWFDRIFESILDQRMKMNAEVGEANHDISMKQNKDFLDILLNLKNKEDPKTPLTMTHIKALLLDMVAGGVDTTSTTLEWAMAEMMHKPEIMKKAQEELESVVGKDKILEDSHCAELHYLEAVVKEALRLHPPNVFLIPHSAIESCVVGGYTIPKNTAIFVNLWEIQRDPSLWDNPSEFIPERFLSSATAGNKWDYRGNDFRYFPFGSGRRICPGISLAERSLKYVLGSLLHSFDWKLPTGTKIDLADKFGQVIKIANPVVAIPTPRLSNPKLYDLLLKEEP
ncbi:cytochrome P450 monooxygenase 76AD131-like [Tasmannia lanceolata]|uniref:cytochrome P450 monooxygenase 76AD131-like n=2 Tax=Tasmannia lanceolata TaxID=3420 RepID=UPI0040642387